MAKKPRKQTSASDESEPLRIVPSAGVQHTKEGTLRSFKDPAGRRFKARTAGGAIKAFLDAHHEALRRDEVDLVETDTSEGAAVVRRRYEQRLHGLRVLGADLKVVAHKGHRSVVSADSTLDHKVGRAPAPERALPLADVEAAILAPFADDYASASIARSSLCYLRYSEHPPLPDADYPGATVALLSAGTEPDGKLHLAYEAQVETDGPFLVFRVLADAVSGELLYVDMMSRFVGAALYVYSPDPVSESGLATLGAGSTAATLDPYRHEVQVEIDPQSGGKYHLRGDWVRCTEIESPTFAQPEENAATFKYQTHPADRRFLSANAYYWIDSVARYLQTLGVATFNNNVEMIEIDPQAWSGADQSDWVGTTSPPRIRMGEGGVPDAADMGVIIHEYTHGVFDWLGSNHGGSGSYEHSVCDALPAIYRDRFNTNGNRRTEVFPWDNVNNLWSPDRRLDMSQRFDDANFNTYGNNKRNSMLATAFWESYIGMGGDSTNASVRIKAADAMIRTMMEMLLIVPDDSSSGVAHARSMAEGCITADTALTGGLYSKVMDDAFIARGLWDLRPTDLYIRDSSADTGAHPSPIPHWHSPDIWVRNNAPGTPGENPADGHQQPITNQPNYMYVTVHNRGNTGAAANAFTVEAFHCNPGTGMIFPDHFTSMGTLTIAQPVPAGGSVQVGPFIWTPTIVDHECLLAIVDGAADPAISTTLTNSVPHAEIVRFDNNVGQRNVAPKASVPGGKTKTAFVMRGGLSRTTNKLTLDASALPADTQITVRTLRRVVDGSTIENLQSVDTGTVWVRRRMTGGAVAVIDGFELATNDQVTVELEIDFSFQAEHLVMYPLIATQEQDHQIAGRMTIEITAVKELEDWVFGNPRSGEMHISTCPFWGLLGAGSKHPFETVDEGLARGYNGCRFCLPEYDTD